jgi:hypothetical protein
MQIFPATSIDTIMGWLTDLDYPWCTPADALRNMPKVDGMTPIEQYLKELRPLPVES